MDKFTEGLAEGLRRFAMAGVGAVSVTVEKSREIIDQLVAKGEVTTAEGQAACEELQKKMSAQFDAFSKKLKKDYEAANFESLLRQCDTLTDEQRAAVIDRVNHPQTPEEAAEDEDAPACPCQEEGDESCRCQEGGEAADCQAERPCECAAESPAEQEEAPEQNPEDNEPQA